MCACRAHEGAHVMGGATRPRAAYDPPGPPPHAEKTPPARGDRKFRRWPDPRSHAHVTNKRLRRIGPTPTQSPPKRPIRASHVGVTFICKGILRMRRSNKCIFFHMGQRLRWKLRVIWTKSKNPRNSRFVAMLTKTFWLPFKKYNFINKTFW